MKTTSSDEGKAHLASPIEPIEASGAMTAARAGKRPGAGIDEGLGWIADHFDAELPPEVLAAFYK